MHSYHFHKRPACKTQAGLFNSLQNLNGFFNGLAKKRAGFGTSICLPSAEFCYVF